MNRGSRIIHIVLLVCVMTGGLRAQICGTVGSEAEAIKARLLANKKAWSEGLVFPRSTQYVPVKFHLVNKTDGSGGILLRNVLDQLCALNADFKSFGIQFYIKDSFNFINDDRLYAHHYNYRNMMETYRDPSAINIWIVDNANPTGFDGYVAGYYTNSKDWLVIQKDEIKAFTFTLPHEMGHYFGLLHTFYGWDSDPWQAAVHGNPAPVMSPNQIPTEEQAGLNCDIAGDFICDTPPDYGFGSYWTDCNYTGGAMDPLGTIVNPDEPNFMGYFDACVRTDYHFSPQQKSVMQTDLASVRRNAIRSNYVPEYLSFSGIAQPQLPTPGSTNPVYTQVNFKWTAVEGATRYLLEISTSPAFSASSTMSLIRKDTASIESLAPSKTYYWRVQPFNEYYTCTNPSTFKNFKTGNLSTSLTTIPEIENWQLSPNPLKLGTSLTLALQTGKEFEAQVAILNLTGQVVQNLGKHRFPVGMQLITLPTEALPAGLYLVTLQTPTGRSVKKIVVQ